MARDTIVIGLVNTVTVVLRARKFYFGFQYLSFTDARLSEGNIFSLSTVHPYGNCLLILLPCISV